MYLGDNKPVQIWPPGVLHLGGLGFAWLISSFDPFVLSTSTLVRDQLGLNLNCFFHGQLENSCQQMNVSFHVHTMKSKSEVVGHLQLHQYQSDEIQQQLVLVVGA